MLKRKIGCLALTAMLAAGIMAGCGGEDNGGKTQVTGAATEAPTPQATVTPEATPTPEPTLTPTPEPTKAEEVSKYEIPEVVMEAKEIPDTDAFKFTKDMKIGWNLGNTLDASDCTWVDDELKYESAWCGVI